MEIAVELIRSITEFMRYLAPGFIFLGCMNFASCRKREERVEYLIISSIALSFVISTFSSTIVGVLSYYDERFYLFSNIWFSVQSMLSLALSVFLGLAAGMLLRTKQANRLSQVLFHRDFRDVFFVYLKDELTKEYAALFVRIKQKNDPCIYVGQIERVLNPIEKPVIILFNYACYDEKGRKTAHRDGECRFLVNYEDIESFEYIKMKKKPSPDTPRSPC